MLGEFNREEAIFQTGNYQEFALARLIDNSALTFISKFAQKLNRDNLLSNYILARVADPILGSELTNELLCPKCGFALQNVNDTLKISERKISAVSWQKFHTLPDHQKEQLITKIIKIYDLRKKED